MNVGLKRDIYINIVGSVRTLKIHGEGVVCRIVSKATLSRPLAPSHHHHTHPPQPFFSSPFTKTRLLYCSAHP